MDIDFENIIVRQRIEVCTEGEKDIDVSKLNSGSINDKFQIIECIYRICNRKFIGIRNTLTKCKSRHFCKSINYVTGNIYKKEIQNWNIVYNKK